MSLPGRDARLGDGTDWSPPAEFHEYKIVRALGRGRTGRVYLAHDALLERTVAVKFVAAESAGALTRLLNEARAAARVQHPNVVTLFRVGQLKDHAYIISEYTRGTSLDRLQKPLPSDKLYATALDLARGLAAAHRAGVLHRDLKPSNAVLTETGTAKLLDFGLAKLVAPVQPAAPTVDGPSTPRDLVAVDGMVLGRLTPGAMRALPGAGELVGTPYYMSPEAWRREEHTVRSDLYSLGAMLYELAAGQAPFRHVAVGELAETVQRREAQPLSERVPSVDGGFAAAVERCLRIDPLERFPSAEALLDALESARALPALVQVPEGNPFRGLRAFEAEHRSLFFGRRRDLRALRERLRSDSFVLLTGDSGVGKSSLAAAGLLPDVAEGGLADARQWSVVRLVPGHNPLLGLAAAIAPALARDEQSLEVGLRADPESFARSLRKRLKPEQGLLIYIDQLEELLTLSHPTEANRFITAITPLVEGVPGVKVVGSIRSDFLTRLGAIPHFGLEAARAIYLVRPLEREELRQAVVGPARVTGVTFETEEMVQALVDAGGGSGGGLPLLQFALAELWDARDHERRMITAATLEKLGGVAGALARHADAVIDALLPEQRIAARSLLLRLVTDDGTRARRTADELGGADPRYGTALEALVRGRLLVVRETDGGNTYEVAHEALLSGWGRLAHWIAQEAETKQVRRRLASAALEWERQGLSSELLWGPQGVAEARVLPSEDLADRERRFLEASQRGLMRARRRRLIVAASALVLAALAAAAVRVQGAIAMRSQVRSELSAGESAHRKAEELVAREAAARTAAFRAFDDGKADVGEQAWAQALAHRAEVEQALNAVGEHLERAAALASDRSEVRDALGGYLLERALRAEEAGRNDLRDLYAQRLVGVDTAGTLQRRFRAPATLTVHAPGTSALHVARYVEAADGHLSEQPVETALRDGAPAELPPGSYVLSRSPDGTRLPVLLARGQRLEVELPAAPPLPPGFVFVPAGTALFGTAAEEPIRRFLEAAPLHPVRTSSFLIARTETTWAEYLAYLEDLEPAERSKRLPRLSSSNHGKEFAFTRDADGWLLEMQPAGQLFRVRAGDRLHYPGRHVRSDVDWLSVPVSGISYDDALAYTAWLDRTGRVPGARICSELEWERAARGADARAFPSGNSLSPEDADFDLAYGRNPLGMGPDAVGSHPGSRSPFGLEDMAGNVWEWTTSVLEPGKPVIRGGSYFHSPSGCQVDNRSTVDPSYRNMTLGIRVCALSPR